MHKDVYGLSCVENQVLSILAQSQMEFSLCYADSAIPLKELFMYFAIEGRDYAHFDRLPRVQDILKERAKITMPRITQADINQVCQVIQSDHPHEYMLIKTTPDFAKKHLFVRGWRDDHYVLVKANRQAFDVVNDIPETTCRLTVQQLSEAYAGDYFKLTIVGELTGEDAQALWKSRKNQPEKSQPFYFYRSDLNDVTDASRKLRDISCMYKLTRYRVQVYYGKYIDTSFMDEYMRHIEKISSLFEYYNIKKAGTEKAWELFHTLNTIDVDMMSELKNRLECKV